MDGRFFTNCVRNIIEKAVSICVIIPQNRKVKKFQLHIIDHSFEHNSMGIIYQKKLESPEEKKAVHTLCEHGVRRICQLYTKGGPAGKLMWCEPLETIWIIADETTYEDPAPKTLDELREWLRFAWKNVTVTLWPCTATNGSCKHKQTILLIHKSVHWRLLYKIASTCKIWHPTG